MVAEEGPFSLHNLCRRLYGRDGRANGAAAARHAAVAAAISPNAAVSDTAVWQGM